MSFSMAGAWREASDRRGGPFGSTRKEHACPTAVSPGLSLLPGRVEMATCRRGNPISLAPELRTFAMGMRVEFFFLFSFCSLARYIRFVYEAISEKSETLGPEEMQVGTPFHDFASKRVGAAPRTLRNSDLHSTQIPLHLA